MALRILWDKYETALLIEAWLNIEQGKQTRQTAVALLSKTLRERAVKHGTEIDKVTPISLITTGSALGEESRMLAKK